MSKFVRNVDGLKEIIDKYEIFILDQWGVMHNGINGYDEAIKCVQYLKELDKTLIIISNSSKRKKATISRLPKLGFNPKFFYEVMTSGEMIWQTLYNQENKFIYNSNKNCYFLFDEKEESKAFIDGLDSYKFVDDIEEADFILASNTKPGLKTIDYVPLLSKAINKNILFVCANPDYETVSNNSDNSDNLEICMGTVAELYKSLGGEVFLQGKPKNDIYIKSTINIKNFNKSKVLAIGDSLHHDILGAYSFGIDSLLVTSGIHSSSFDKKNPEWHSNSNNYQTLDFMPTFLCSKFKL